MKTPTLWLDAAALGAMGTALGFALLLSLELPQRIALRTAREGVIALHVNRDGSLRVWNQRILPQELPGLLRRAASRTQGGGSLGGAAVRLVPDQAVPWGTVQALVAQIELTGLPLEVQLP